MCNTRSNGVASNANWHFVHFFLFFHSRATSTNENECYIRRTHFSSTFNIYILFFHFVCKNVIILCILLFRLLFRCWSSRTLNDHHPPDVVYPPPLCTPSLCTAMQKSQNHGCAVAHISTFLQLQENNLSIPCTEIIGFL